MPGDLLKGTGGETERNKLKKVRLALDTYMGDSYNASTVDYISSVWNGALPEGYSDRYRQQLKKILNAHHCEGTAIPSGGLDYLLRIQRKWLLRMMGDIYGEELAKLLTFQNKCYF